MNQVFKHPSNEQMQVEVIMASHATADHPPIYTIRMRYPRIIHGEIMTHRMFSRNARSSRAVPVQTMLNEVRTSPFVPWHWGANQKGMQASEECSEPVKLTSFFPGPLRKGYQETTHRRETHERSREIAWKLAAYEAANHAEAFMDAGYHKQIVNRLLEPFSWIDTLITSTNWSNFLWLRDHKDAEPHLQDLARLVAQAIDETDLQDLQSGEWHLPYIKKPDLLEAISQFKDKGDEAGAFNFLRKISAARCARISYKPFDGDASYERELERYDMLVSADRVHASPLEHQATPDRFDRLVCEYAGEMDYSDPKTTWANPHLHGNFSGWIQARKLVANEAH